MRISWELKGQVLLESGRAAEALAPLRKATAMAPNAAPMKVLYRHALVSTDTPANTAEAIGVLANATQRDHDSAEGFEFLSMGLSPEGRDAEGPACRGARLVRLGQVCRGAHASLARPGAV
jgi:predicted Zn-dependent protease